MKLYSEVLPLLQGMFRNENPYKEDMGISKSQWERDMNARAFDVARGLLPAGVRTGLSVHMTISGLRERCLSLRHHQTQEVREIGEAMSLLLHKVMPDSGFDKKYAGTERYYEFGLQPHLYSHNSKCPEFECVDSIDTQEVMDTFGATSFGGTSFEKVEHCPIPDQYKGFGSMTFNYKIPFAEWREIGRHRAVYQPLPLHTTEFGFHPWYLDRIRSIGSEGEKIVDRISKLSELLKMEFGYASAANQYTIPIGYRVSARITGHLWGLAELVETRYTPSVHPILFGLVCEMRKAIAKYVVIKPEGVEPPHGGSHSRGNETILLVGGGGAIS